MSHKSELERSRRLYSALGLHDCAANDEVKKAYRELALMHHPDKNPDDPDAMERFKEVNTAYQVLSNAERKKSYDATLSTPGGMFARSRSGNPSGGSTAATRNGSSSAAAGGTRGRVFTETNLQDELNQFRASRRTASASFKEPAPRSGSANTRTAPKSSSYSKEQQEIFKQHEKEREVEMKKRLEKEREARREAEIDRCRRLQAEKDKEEERRRVRREKLQRDTVEKVFDDKPRPPPRRANSMSGRTPPPPATAGEASNVNLASTGTFGLASPTFNTRSGEYELPRSAADEALQAQRTVVDRQRKERERQEEVRRKEQERFLERKLHEVRIREEEKQRVREKEDSSRFANRFSNLQLEEEQERCNSVVPEEKHERNSIMASLRNIVAQYRFSRAVRDLSSEELKRRHYLSADEIVGRTLTRLGGRENAARAVIFSECRLNLETLQSQQYKEVGLIKSHLSQQIVFDRSEKAHRSALVASHYHFVDQLELLLCESKIRIILSEQFDSGIVLLSSALFDTLHRSFMDDELWVVRNQVQKEEEAARRLLSLERRCLGERAMIAVNQDKNFLDFVQQRATGATSFQRSAEVSLEKTISELQQLRADDREEKNKMALELSRLHNQLHASQNENEVLHSAHKLARSEVEASGQKLRTQQQPQQRLDAIPFELGGSDEEDVEAADAPGAGRSTAVLLRGQQRMERELGEKEDELRGLRLKCQRLQEDNAKLVAQASRAPTTAEARIAAASAAVSGGGGGESKELVSLLCAENRRLLETNAKLSEELKMSRSASANHATRTPTRTGSWTSPQVNGSTTPSPISIAAANTSGASSSFQRTKNPDLLGQQQQQQFLRTDSDSSAGGGAAPISPLLVVPGPLTSTRSPANHSKLWHNNSDPGYAASSSYFSNSSPLSPPNHLKQRAAAAIGGANAQTQAAQRRGAGATFARTNAAGGSTTPLPSSHYDDVADLL